jgi:uncharacterized membrane protein SpoIIM required for sporulation
MKQDAFEARYEPTWEQFEDWIRVLTDDRNRLRSDPTLHAEIGSRFPALFRQVCHHLALARTRQYSIALQQRLNELALDGHQHLYRTPVSVFGQILRFLALDFPSAVRKRWRYVLASALMFSLPAIGMAVATVAKPELVYSLVDPAQVSGIESMYDPDNQVLGRERESDSDLQMFGFYIYNNISIGFQTFAGGLLFGLGSLFYLVFNGLFVGAVSTHLTTIGYTETFWPFVAGHSSFVVTAVVIFGGVGLMFGYGAIAPGRKIRWHAIRDRATAGVGLS